MTKMLFQFIGLIMLISNFTFGQIAYPETKKVVQEDDYFGTKVSDPYRWLENDNSEETKSWVKEQNTLTYSYLEKIPYRQKIKDRLTKIWNFARQTAPFREAGKLFFFKNDGLQNQSVLYYQKSKTDKPELLLDPNKLAEDGTASLSNYSVSHDGKYLAFGVSKAGSDWVEIKVLDIATKQILNDHMNWVKFSNISWKGNGFYYSAFNKPEDGKALTKKNEFHKVFYHTIGDPQSKDQLVFEDKSHGERLFTATVTDDEHFLVINGSESTSGQSIIIKDLNKKDAPFLNVVDNFENEYSLVDNVGDDIYFLTDYKAPRYQLIKISASDSEQSKWKTVLKEEANLLESVQFCGSNLLVKYLVDVSSRLFLYSSDGKKLSEVKLPGLCKVDAVQSSKKFTDAYYSLSSFVAPTSIFSYDATKNISKLVFKPAIDFKSDQYETKQVFFYSKDSTKIPMFITYKKGLKWNGQNPCFLYGYGGFNSYYAPEFRIDRAVFLEAGGIYAIANIRGGGEYGEEWHKAGTKCKKQNVFDDFIAAAEYLVKEKYTTHQKLAIHGRSNGGLLIGAVMTQRPDIARVCIPTVGVLDMLRFHLFTIGRAWGVDYGLSENKEEFECLYKYSPLHNVKSTAYPATLITTGDHDDRVVPAHSFKFAATLQENNMGKNPILIRIDVNAGHGSGKPTAKQIDEAGDIWAFVFYNLGMNF